MGCEYTIARILLPESWNRYEEFAKEEIEQSIGDCFDGRAEKISVQRVVKHGVRRLTIQVLDREGDI
jgi:hypothetical protein